MFYIKLMSFVRNSLQTRLRLRDITCFILMEKKKSVVSEIKQHRTMDTDRNENAALLGLFSRYESRVFYSYDF